MTPDLASLAERFGGTLDDAGFDPTIRVPRKNWRALAAALAADGVWFSDVTAVDTGETVDVVAHVCASRSEQITLKTALSDDDLTVDSLVPVWPGVEWLEREVYDMFGVSFDGHPDMTRILLYEGFEGYPLRKSFLLDVEEDG